MGPTAKDGVYQQFRSVAPFASLTFATASHWGRLEHQLEGAVWSFSLLLAWILGGVLAGDFVLTPVVNSR